MSKTRMWDVFVSSTLQVRRSLSREAILQSIDEGSLTMDDLVRSADTREAWKRMADFMDEEQKKGNSAESSPSKSSYSEQGSMSSFGEDQDLLDPNADIDLDSDSGLSDEPSHIAETNPSIPPVQMQADLPSIELQALQWLTEEDPPASEPKPHGRKEIPAIIQARTESRPNRKAAPQDLSPLESSIELELPHGESQALFGQLQDDDGDEVDDFSLSRSRVEHVEEMDLAAMVDIAFQLVLFFMVTASVTMIKSMELPKPTESTKPAAASAPGVGTRDKNQLESEFIVVAISADGEILVDDEPTRADQLVERLRSARNESGKTGMLLRAENKTKHRTAVAAYDAANEIGLRIAIERDTVDQ